MLIFGRILLAGVLTLSAVSLALAQDRSLDNLADQLIRLRSEVESLHSELETKRENNRTELRSLASQKADLEAKRRREDLNVKQLEDDLAEKRQKAEQAGATGEALAPAVLASVDELESSIASRLPFKRGERTDALEKLKSQLNAGAITAQRAVNRLWGFYEDELRLTQENGIHSQVIDVKGNEMLVDVAKLGTVLMYFRTKDQRYGMAVPDASGNWQFRFADDGGQRQQIRTLFDSLTKQIRTGYFALPNPGLPGEVGS